MEENGTTKIYCGDRDRGSDALAYAAMAGNRDNDPMAMAAMMGGGLNGCNNPFAYMMMFGMMRLMYGDNWQNGGNGAVQRAEIQSQLDSLRNQMSDNHNSDLLMGAIHNNDQDLRALSANLNCDFNQLQTAVCAVRSAIEQVAGQVGYSAERVINAVNLGDLNIIQQFKDCCCQTQQNIIKMGYDNQLGQKDIVNQIQQGFSYTNTGIERAASNLGFQMQQDKCDVIRAGENNTQRIIDTLTGHWSQEQANEIQDLKFKNSQLQQNIYFANLMNGGCGCGAGVAGGYQ